MLDSNVNPTPGVAGDPHAAAAPRLGFCQNCGRELTAANVRYEGTAMFCDLCHANRQTARAAAGGWQPVNHGPRPGTGPQAGVPPNAGYGYGQAAPPVSGSPNPNVAAMLGFIPGVGAMYNGQFAKGFAHLLIFIVVQSLDKTFHGIFGLLVAGMVFYQVFDAYATAKARRDGQPLPDPFGLNDIGERVGFHGARSAGGTRTPYDPQLFANWFGQGFGSGFGANPTAPPVPPVPPVPPTYTAGPSYADVGSAQTPPASPVPPPTGYASDPASHAYTAPQNPFASQPQPDPMQAMHGQGWHHTATPYQSTFTGAAAATDFQGQPIAPPPAGSRFPVAAIWLIGLGFLFLLGNLLPSWHITAHWMGPVAMACLALWIFQRRWSALQGGLTGADLIHGPSIRQRAFGAIRVPALLLTLAVLLGLQAADWVSMAHTWPILLLVFGGLMLADRVLAQQSRRP